MDIPRKLTRHGRDRFIERVGFLHDDEILAVASNPVNPKFRFIWKLKRIRGKWVNCLVTVI